MGIYDAFKGHTEKIDMSKATSNSGSVASAFGNAFVDISKSMREVDGERARQGLIDAQTDVKSNELETLKAESTQKNLDDAFKRDYLGAGDSKVSPEVLEAQNAFVSQEDQTAQVKFNDAAVESSVVGGYKNMNEFLTDAANKELVFNADGVTLTKIDKYFSDKDTKVKDLKAAEKDVKHATALSKIQAQLAKANKKGSKDAFAYTEVTDAKIASQVKTAMGMDAPDFSFDDTTKVAYENAVAGSAAISKKYSLEPSLAIHVYQNPELYEFTADNKVLVKKVTTKKEEPTKKSASWKEYQ